MRLFRKGTYNAFNAPVYTIYFSLIIDNCSLLIDKRLIEMKMLQRMRMLFN